MNETKEIISIAIDQKTKKLLDKYGENHSISRSAAIRTIVNEFFIKMRGS